jgi:hypothetical protein
MLVGNFGFAFDSMVRWYPTFEAEQSSSDGSDLLLPVHDTPRIGVTFKS